VLRGGEGENRRLSCREAECLLSEFADGVLERGVAAQVEAHLRGCEACRRLLAEERAENALLGKVLGANRLGARSLRRLRKSVLEELPSKVEHVYVTRPGHVRIGPIEFRLSFWVPLAAAAAAFLVAFMLRPVTVARIADMAGNVMLRRSGDAEWEDASARSGLRAGDAVRTEAFAARLALRDGTSLEIEPFSEIAIGGETPELRQVVELRQGKLVAQVVRSKSAFRVKTDYADVSVVGTRFRTALRRGMLQQISVLDVAVEEGTVEVSSPVGACLVGEGERVFVGMETDLSLIRTDEAESRAGEAYRDILTSLPSSTEDALLVRESMEKLAELVARYPNTRWSDDAMWVLSFVHPAYVLFAKGEPDMSGSVQICSEWVNRYGDAARLEEWTVTNFPSLLRGQSVASRSVVASSSRELRDLMAIHKCDVYLWLGRELARAGKVEEALDAYSEGLNVLQVRPQAAEWLLRLEEEVEGELRRWHDELKMQLRVEQSEREAAKARLQAVAAGTEPEARPARERTSVSVQPQPKIRARRR